jgi:DNA-binding GntR family transcriptional regulator
MTDVIERDSATPIYQQLEDIFHAKIASGEWSRAHPSENELNREYSLSRMTIRGVLNKLAGGLLIRVLARARSSPCKRSTRSLLHTKESVSSSKCSGTHRDDVDFYGRAPRRRECVST